MSLRHILNDEPPPVLPRQPYVAPSRMSSADHPPYPEDPRLSPQPGSPSRPYLRQSREAPEPRSYYRPSVIGQHDTSWDSRPGDWPTDDAAPYASEQRRYPYDRDSVVSPIDVPQPLPQQDEQDVISKKRRKGGDHDADYMPTKPRRVSSFMNDIWHMGSIIFFVR